jgi:hypothetical protein
LGNLGKGLRAYSSFGICRIHFFTL